MADRVLAMLDDRAAPWSARVKVLEPPGGGGPWEPHG